MASSTSRITEPWIPALPDNEIEVGQNLRHYRAALVSLRQSQGIPGLLAELARINAEQQRVANQSLAAALSTRLQDTMDRLDAVTPRSRPTASPTPASVRGRVAQASGSPRPDPLTVPSKWRSLGPGAAGRIVAAQQRAEARRAAREEAG